MAGHNIAKISGYAEITFACIGLLFILSTVLDRFDIWLISRPPTVEEKIQMLLKPYKEATGRYSATADIHDLSLYQNNATADLYDIYRNKNPDHKTCLITTDRCLYNLHVVILITSNLGNFRRRQNIRRTWGEDPVGLQPRWKTYFLIGRSNNETETNHVAVEIVRHNDIILGDVSESFYNLSHKIQMGLEWADEYCRFKFLFKGDDDVFLNIPRLLEFLDDGETPKTSLYAGNVHYAARVARKGRYGVSKSEYRKDIYPRYCSGGGFVVTPDVVKKFLAVITNVSVIKIDDAYVGELALKSSVDVFHDESFLNMYVDDRQCTLTMSSVVHHPVKTLHCMNFLYEETVRSIIETGSEVNRQQFIAEKKASQT